MSCIKIGRENQFIAAFDSHLILFYLSPSQKGHSQVGQHDPHGRGRDVLVGTEVAAVDKQDDFGRGKKYIQYKQIFEAGQINLNDCGLVNIEDNEKQNQVQYGDIFFTMSSETPQEIRMASVAIPF